MYTGKILDPIHGLIEMTEIEKWVLQQKVFNRLRRVKQNTLLNYVFPGANHTRFEHSIGVMHLTEQIFNKSNENVEISRLKSEKYGTKTDWTTIPELLNGDTEKLNVLKQELRLAALLHDVGHGPTSHKFDDFTIRGEDLISILETKKEVFGNFIATFKKYLSRIGKNGKAGLENRIEHELVSCVFIIKIIHKLKTVEKLNSESIKIAKQINVKNIIKMIDPSFDPEYEIKIGNNIITDYLNSIISSFPIDADRMDYLYRDSFFSGVKYGFYDLSRILMSVIPIEYNGRYTLGLKSSGLDSIIRFIQSRNHLYNQVYFHKTNTSTNTMLDFIFRHLNHKSVIEAKTYDEFEEFYWKNSDEYFFNVTLKKILGENGCEQCGDQTCIEDQVLDELLRRKLWKRVYEKKYNIKDRTEIDSKRFDAQKVESVLEKLENEGIHVSVNYNANIALKGDTKSKIVVLQKENDEYKISKDWHTINEELDFLNQTNVLLTRIYLRKTFNDASEYKAIKDRIIALFKEKGLI